VKIDTIIEALGGTTEVAMLCDVLPQTVSNWKRRGAVPSAHYLTLTRELDKLSIPYKPAMFGFKRHE
jgi:hypothetical protein